jgi:hypothetical protein
MRARAALYALLMALAVPAVAVAATPVDLGPGTHPHVVVDAAGTGQLTWGETISGQLADVAHFCQLAKGATACANPHSFTYPSGANEGEDSGVWPLLPGDGRVLVLDSRCCQVYAKKFLYVSADGGTSFGAGTEVGDDNNLGADILGAALYAPPGALGRPAESVLTFGSLATIGLSFQATGTTGPPANATSADVLTQGDASDGALALSSGTLVAAWEHIDDSTLYWRRYTGAGDVNDQASWTPIAPLDSANIQSGPRLAGGPSGTYVAYLAGPSGSQAVVLRKFNGSGWDPPVTLSDVNATNRFDLSEDPGGVLHFVWQDSKGRLRYRSATAPGNSTFTPAQTLATPVNPVNLRLAVSASGNGWATYEDAGHVKALAVAPGPPPPTRGVTVNAALEKGTVRVKAPGGGFVPLESVGSQIPGGSTVDATNGTVHLFAATDSTGATQDGHFNGGMFVIGQGKSSPLTTLSLTGGGLRACGKTPRGGSPRVTAAARSRRLFSNVHGAFRTRGRNSTATVRGTRWLTTDTCAGTVTLVRSGIVVVRDLVKHRTVTLKKGQRYLARRGGR